MELQILKEIREGGTTLYAQDPHLFARVPLEDRLSLDTDSGQLILQRVKTVWIQAAPGVEARGGAPPANPAAAAAVFEALVVNREDFNIVEPLHSADFVYLSLSGHFVKQYALQPGQTISVDIQFQLDRRSFVEWTYAIETLLSPDIIFPNTFLHANISLIQKISELIQKYPKVEYVYLLFS